MDSTAGGAKKKTEANLHLAQSLLQLNPLIIRSLMHADLSIVLGTNVSPMDYLSVQGKH
jgi:hypothetical protein